jgi:hypothetical protein
MKFPTVIRIVGDGYNEGLFIRREEGGAEIKHLSGFEAKTAPIIIQINRTRGAGTLDERFLAFFITTNNVFTPENTSKVITLAGGADFKEIVTIASDDLKTCNYASGGNSTNRGINLRAFINTHRLISNNAIKSSRQKLPTLMSLLLKIVVLTHRY